MAIDTHAAPYVPVVAPDPPIEPTEVDYDPVGPVTIEGLGQDDLAAREARRRFLIYGLGGVVVGSILTSGMTALALRSYRETGSILRPALLTGLGSAAMGGGMVFLLSRVVGKQQIDPRALALAMGVRMAA